MKKSLIAIRQENKKINLSLLAGAALLFLLAARIASTKTISPWEGDILLAIYNWPDWLRPLGVAVTQFGSAGMAVLVALFLLTGRERSRHLGRLVLANSAVTYGLVIVVKQIIGRPRPVELIQHLQQHDFFITGLGFPSGHTALATVISLVLTPFLPRRLRWLPILWIILVGLSRVYLGVHAPLDIIGGFALGLAVVSTQRLLRVR